MSQELALLIKRSADLKRDLVRFTQGPRFERSLTAALLEAADPEGELNETGAIGVIDRFALQHRLPGGDTVVDRFVASHPARPLQRAARGERCSGATRAATS